LKFVEKGQLGGGEKRDLRSKTESLFKDLEKGEMGGTATIRSAITAVEGFKGKKTSGGCTGQPSGRTFKVRIED